MKIHRSEQSILLPRDLDAVWPFFSNPRNRDLDEERVALVQRCQGCR